ncbi:MAG: hypothetical protein ABI589_02040 [Burkholderiales bacterium]
MRTLKQLLLTPLAIAPLLCAAQDSNRVAVDDLRILLIAALDSPTGEAHGRLTGDMARLLAERFRTSGPLLIDVSTERRYKQAGCSRLKVSFTQEGVNLPGASAAERKSVDVGLNYCRDGKPPSSLS